MDIAAIHDSIFYTDLFRGIRIPSDASPDGYFEILNRLSRRQYSVGDDLFFGGYFDIYTGSTHPDKNGELIYVLPPDDDVFWIGFKPISYLSSPYLALKYQEEIIENSIRLDEPLPDDIFEELLDLMAPSLIFNGEKFRPVKKLTVEGISLVQEIGFRTDKDLNRCCSTQILSDDGQYLVEVVLGRSAIVFNVDYDIETGFQYNGYGRSPYSISYFGPISFDRRPRIDGAIAWKKPSTLEFPRYQDYDRYNNITRSLLVTEYAARDTQLDGKIEPLWFGWGPLPPSLGFDVSKLSVVGEPSAGNIYRPEKQENQLVWNQDINNLFGEIVPAIDPNSSTTYQNINPGKYVLIPDNY